MTSGPNKNGNVYDRNIRWEVPNVKLEFKHGEFNPMVLRRLYNKPVENVLITGVTGQTGSYLAELYLSKGYNVFGLARRVSVDTTWRIKGCLQNKNFKLIAGDITDYSSLINAFATAQPHIVINCAAQSHVHVSFDQPLLTWDITAKGALNIIEIIRQQYPSVKFIQLSSSEMFGSSVSAGNVQDLNTPFCPQSPYSVAKLAVHNTVQLYRKCYGLHLTSCINFNKESPRRGDNFVTKKITKYIGEIMGIDYVPAMLTPGEFVINKTTLKRFSQQSQLRDINTGGCINPKRKLKLGNIYASRDWMHAKDAAEAIYLMSLQPTADDYVVCSGETKTIVEFLDEAFHYVGKNFNDYIEIDETLKRPAEVPFLRGDNSYIRNKLGWYPKVTFKELVKEMVDYDIQDNRKY